MTEKHPFLPFVPKNSRYLLLGSFPGKKTPENTWYYGTKRTQLWKILEGVYKRDLGTLQERKKIFTDLRIALSDVICECERIKGTNLDNNLKITKYNFEIVDKIIRKNKIERIFFSSKFVEKIYRKVFKAFIDEFPEVTLTTLPSPSPRYAKLSLQEKIGKYKKILPKID